MTFDVVVIGPVTQDVTLAVDDVPEAGGSTIAYRVREAVGGKGGNPAIACARLGARTALVGAVGGDKLGKRLRKQLRRAGVDVHMVEALPDRETGRITHIVQPDGRRRFIESVGANDHVTIDTKKLESALSADNWLVISTALPLEPLLDAVAVARKAGARVAMDLAGSPQTSEALLSFASLVRVDATEASELTGNEVSNFESAGVAARWFQVRGPDLVVVQAGSDGDLLRVHTDEHRAVRQPMTTVDPTGAGDALIATLVVRLAAGDEPDRALRLASAAAGHTAGQFGGSPQFDLAELDALVGEADSN